MSESRQADPLSSVAPIGGGECFSKHHHLTAGQDGEPRHINIGNIAGEAADAEQVPVVIWPRQDFKILSHDEVKRQVADCQRDGLTIRLTAVWDGPLW